MADIQVTGITDGSLSADNEWSGTGVFDKLIEAVNKNIEAQWNKNRIDGKEYAEVYLGSMQSVIAQSVQYILQEKSIEADIAIKEKELEIKAAQLALTERQVAEVENNINIKERQMVEAELTGAKTRENITTQISKIHRDIAVAEKQIASITVNDEYKGRMTAAEEEVKASQVVINNRQASRLEAETASIASEDARRNASNKKDLEVKDAQKTKTYRDAMLAEQQQLLLANQTSYEAEKTNTLKLNTQANMLIRTIDGGVTETNGYLTNGLTPPAQLVKVVSEARADLVELSGVEYSDYIVEDTYLFEITGTSITGTPNHTQLTRWDGTNLTSDITSYYFTFYIGDLITFNDTATPANSGVYKMINATPRDVTNFAAENFDNSTYWQKQE